MCRRGNGLAGSGVAVMAATRIVVIGGNFGGLTAALELKHELGADVEVTVH
jgi:monoamine oxidase